MSKKLNKVVGNLGEDFACNYLIKNNYQIIERNYRTQRGEIDIIESVNNENKVYSTCHWMANGQHADYGQSTGVFDIYNFHTYYLQWDQDYIRAGVDGKQHYEIYIKDGTGQTQAFHKPFFFILNVAVGGNWPGFNIDDSQFPTEMQVDYIRVYQK